MVPLNRDYEIMTVHISLAVCARTFSFAPKVPGVTRNAYLSASIYALTFCGYILFDTRDFSTDP